MAITEKAPNIVVFFTDQQRWDTMGLHGNPMGLTPNLDRLARQHTHVAHSFTCQPVCGPARSCLQTGLYATTTGCYRNAIPLPDDSRTLAHYFADAGYSTGYIGKCISTTERPRELFQSHIVSAISIGWLLTCSSSRRTRTTPCFTITTTEKCACPATVLMQ